MSENFAEKVQNHRPLKIKQFLSLPSGKAEVTQNPFQNVCSSLLDFSPDGYLLFPDTERSHALIAIRNTHHSPVAFKIKTTSPTGYQVNPRQAILKPGSTQYVIVSAKYENKQRIKEDKFVVHIIAVDDDVSLCGQVNWKATHDESMLHRSVKASIA
ncbi:hypothetical protein CAPTEDRAFT_216201 [Capitella teleta]|uniref:MSP domain-containing protein n=1 Tax=Capitella teleta TaxID=283909 RepID=R7VCR8_CAPTE|nr:hypothetical protein CAPTEDRAFT_216201 [Capitella teleta]|eukprot:ELU13475.1 hypothetical protein CAPTEDRAFT_216201 [Capitella teleta]